MESKAKPARFPDGDCVNHVSLSMSFLYFGSVFLAPAKV
jgi:hypothetical protein